MDVVNSRDQDDWAELERSVGASIRSHIAPGAQTVIVTWPKPMAMARAVLRVMCASLEKHGIARGRQLILLIAGHGTELAPLIPDELTREFGVRAITHDPRSSPCFLVDRFDDGFDLEINDELREAEALVFIGPMKGGTPQKFDTFSGYLSLGLTFRVVMMAGIASERCAQAIFDLGPAWTDRPIPLIPDVSVAWNEEGLAWLAD